MPALANPLIEPLPDTRQTGLRTKSFRKSCVDFHWHFHPEIELVHVKKGRGVRYVGNSMEPFSDGDLCLIGANVPHAFGSSPAERRGAEWIVGHFLPEVWGEAFWRLPENHQIIELLRRARQGVYFELGQDPVIPNQFRAVEQETGVRRLTLWLDLLEHLAHWPHQHALNAVPLFDAKPNPRLQQILTWVEDHAENSSLNQSDAARQVGLSPQAFCRFFRINTGRPFHRYVNEVRVARAGSALVGSGRSVSEIAYAVGFGNLANFNRRFREITGTTPREYRRAHGGLN